MSVEFSSGSNSGGDWHSVDISSAPSVGYSLPGDGGNGEWGKTEINPPNYIVDYDTRPQSNWGEMDVPTRDPFKGRSTTHLPNGPAVVVSELRKGKYKGTQVVTWLGKSSWHDTGEVRDVAILPGGRVVTNAEYPEKEVWKALKKAGIEREGLFLDDQTRYLDQPRIIRGPKGEIYMDGKRIQRDNFVPPDHSAGRSTSVTATRSDSRFSWFNDAGQWTAFEGGHHGGSNVSPKQMEKHVADAEKGRWRKHLNDAYRDEQDADSPLPGMGHKQPIRVTRDETSGRELVEMESDGDGRTVWSLGKLKDAPDCEMEPGIDSSGTVFYIGSGSSSRNLVEPSGKLSPATSLKLWVGAMSVVVGACVVVSYLLVGSNTASARAASVTENDTSSNSSAGGQKLEKQEDMPAVLDAQTDYVVYQMPSSKPNTKTVCIAHQDKEMTPNLQGVLYANAVGVPRTNSGFAALVKAASQFNYGKEEDHKIGTYQFVKGKELPYAHCYSMPVKKASNLNQHTKLNLPQNTQRGRS